MNDLMLITAIEHELHLIRKICGAMMLVLKRKLGITDDDIRAAAKDLDKAADKAAKKFDALKKTKAWQKMSLGEQYAAFCEISQVVITDKQL